MKPASHKQKREKKALTKLQLPVKPEVVAAVIRQV